ncbi:MAG: hypothetical protein ACRC1R_02215 [Cetobacterium sp.]|uniref:hypothetical protein n=1 Tax=Cetobacterium sp. TaxID=2071632 RepID=UPI003F2D774F
MIKIKIQEYTLEIYKNEDYLEEYVLNSFRDILLRIHEVSQRDFLIKEEIYIEFFFYNENINDLKDGIIAIFKETLGDLKSIDYIENNQINSIYKKNQKKNNLKKNKNLIGILLGVIIFSGEFFLYKNYKETIKTIDKLEADILEIDNNIALIRGEIDKLREKESMSKELLEKLRIDKKILKDLEGIFDRIPETVKLLKIEYIVDKYLIEGITENIDDIDIYILNLENKFQQVYIDYLMPKGGQVKFQLDLKS